MLDTVILNIPRGSYYVLIPERFTPPVRLDYQKSFYTKFMQNPTAEDKRLGIYKPRLTINKRGSVAPLKVEFSVEKLLKGNNLEEAVENQFNDLINALAIKLWDMGVAVHQEVLEAAEVVSFHPSKNIPIDSGYTAMGIIKELGKVNLTEKLDLTKTNFRNSGHSLQYYSKSHSLVFYDKILDLQKSENRAIDTDLRLQQLNLLDFMQQKSKPEILRMEVRLSEKIKMKAVLSALGLPSNPSFKDIFRNEVCQKVLLYYFNTYILPSLFVFDLDNNPQSNLSRILRANPKTKPVKALYLLGLQTVSKDKGIKELRKLIEPKNSLRTWQRIASDLKLVNNVADLKHSHSFIRDIKQALEKFIPYRF